MKGLPSGATLAAPFHEARHLKNQAQVTHNQELARGNVKGDVSGPLRVQEASHGPDPEW